MSEQEQIDVVIVGAGGFAKEVHAWLPEVYSPATHRLKGFLGQVDRHFSPDVIGDPLEYSPQANDRFVLAIGDLAARRKVTQAIEGKGGRFVDFVHPASHITPTAKIGRGAVIFPFALLSNCATIGDFVHLSLYASVGHDATTGDNCYLAPYATLNGESRIGDDVLLGSHATVATGVRVGNECKVSANSCVMRDAPAASLVHGVPGRCSAIVEVEGDA